MFQEDGKKIFSVHPGETRIFQESGQKIVIITYAIHPLGRDGKELNVNIIIVITIINFQPDGRDGKEVAIHPLGRDGKEVVIIIIIVNFQPDGRDGKGIVTIIIIINFQPDGREGRNIIKNIIIVTLIIIHHPDGTVGHEAKQHTGDRPFQEDGNRK